MTTFSAGLPVYIRAIENPRRMTAGRVVNFGPSFVAVWIESTGNIKRFSGKAMERVRSRVGRVPNSVKAARGPARHPITGRVMH